MRKPHGADRRHDIMSTEEKQATAKQAFVFLVPLLSEQPVKQAIKHEVRVHDIMIQID